MSGIRARPYADPDLPLLQQTVANWISVAGRCGYDHVGELPHRIYENLRGRWPVGDVVHLWDDAEGLAGIVITMRFGVAFDVFAAPRHRGGVAEREMLRAAFDTTARLMSGTGEPFVLTDVFDCDADRIRLLSDLGFEHFRNWEHVRECDLTAMDFGTGTGGFVLRSARFEDADQLAIARNDCFGENWSGERYRAEVMEKPGYDPEREVVAEAVDGRIAAFAVYWLDHLNKTGHFEPVGTHSGFQRRGLARAVMLHAMRQMRELGLTIVTVNHLADNTSARKLYESLGFMKRHETLGYRRHLP